MSYQRREHSLWSILPLLPVVWDVSLCWHSSSLYHLQSEGGWEPKWQTDYCYPFYFLHSWLSKTKNKIRKQILGKFCKLSKRCITRYSRYKQLQYLKDTLCRKLKKWRRTHMFPSGNMQDKSKVAAVLSSSAMSCWALKKASCSSVGRAGSGRSLKNCFTRPATSQGGAVARHSSPASSLAW